MRRTSRSPRLGGFTLIELLVVIFIILLISAVTLPTIVPAMNHRRVSEAARFLQAALVGARDAAIHYDDPRGIRLIPDSTLPPNIVAANRILSIEPAGDYTEGFVTIHRLPNNSPWLDPITGLTPTNYLIIYEELTDPNTGGPNPRTSWAWNIRVGERFRLNDSGRYYTVIGPMVNASPEGFVNYGNPEVLPLPSPSDPTSTSREFLYLTNGEDDNQNGYVDEQWDGIDNDLNGKTDYINDTVPFGNTTVPNPFETEPEDWVGLEKSNPTTVNVRYTIERRPVPTQGAREVALPPGVYIDMTTWNTTVERSRLPIYPNQPYVDIMLNPTGQVVPTRQFASPAAFGLSASFYHFWIAEREDLHEPPLTPQSGVPYQLPMPLGTPGFPAPGDTVWGTSPLRGEMRLLTLYTRTGNIAVNQVVPATLISTGPPPIYSSGFLGTNVNQPYIEAELGVRSAQ